MLLTECARGEPTYMLRAQLAESEHTRRLMEERLRTTKERAELAERSARDAWQFAPSVMRRPSRPIGSE